MPCQQVDIEMTLKIAVPSKGRMLVGTVDWFKSHGSTLIQSGDGRGYTGVIKGRIDSQVRFFSAGDIPAELAAGSVHFGITGMDVVQENIPSWERCLEVVAELGFGRADLAISVPKFWIDAETVDDLDEIAFQFRRVHGRRLRIATKYNLLVHEFLMRRGVADYQLLPNHGATEGTVANNVAEAIADLVSTGATLSANGLKRLSDGTVLRSQATLFKSRSANWAQVTKEEKKSVLAAARRTADVFAGARPI